MKKLFRRIEIKYRVTKEQFNILFPILLTKMRFDEYCNENGYYQIFNIYYDNDSNDIINHSISKPKFKEKLRLRSYQEVNDENQIIFAEIKKKLNNVIYKRRDYLQINEINEINQFQTQVFNEINYLIDSKCLEPKVYIAYDRIALFATHDDEFRVTFDYNIRTRRKNLSLRDTDDNQYITKKDEYIMEVKINQSMELWLSDILTKLKIFPASFSKYEAEYKKFKQLERSIA